MTLPVQTRGESARATAAHVPGSAGFFTVPTGQPNRCAPLGNSGPPHSRARPRLGIARAIGPALHEATAAISRDSDSSPEHVRCAARLACCSCRRRRANDRSRTTDTRNATPCSQLPTDSRFRIKARPPDEDQERRLKRILGVVLVAQDGTTDAQDHGPVPLDQRLKRQLGCLITPVQVQRPAARHPTARRPSPGQRASERSLKYCSLPIFRHHLGLPTACVTSRSLPGVAIGSDFFANSRSAFYSLYLPAAACSTALASSSSDGLISISLSIWIAGVVLHHYPDWQRKT